MLTRTTNDAFGNPRYICHFLSLLSKEEKNQQPFDIQSQYNLAMLKSKKLGGKRFTGKRYGGGVVFTAHSPEYLEQQINYIAGTTYKA